MTTTDKLSIAELQAGARRRMGTTTLQDYEATGRDLIAAAPVLLEIAAAALAWSESDGDDVLIERVLLAAVSKVRP